MDWSSFTWFKTCFDYFFKLLTLWSVSLFFFFSDEIAELQIQLDSGQGLEITLRKSLSSVQGRYSASLFLFDFSYWNCSCCQYGTNVYYFFLRRPIQKSTRETFNAERRERKNIEKVKGNKFRMFLPFWGQDKIKITLIVELKSFFAKFTPCQTCQIFLRRFSSNLLVIINKYF